MPTGPSRRASHLQRLHAPVRHAAFYFRPPPPQCQHRCYAPVVKRNTKPVGLMVFNDETIKIIRHCTYLVSFFFGHRTLFFTSTSSLSIVYNANLSYSTVFVSANLLYCRQRRYMTRKCIPVTILDLFITWPRFLT